MDANQHHPVGGIQEGCSLASKRDYYNKLFENYPDVVNTKQFREMLGGVNEKTVLYLLRRDQVKHFRIRNAYMIPKVWVIDYVLIEHYAKYKNELSVQD